MPRPALPKEYINDDLGWAETLTHLTTVCEADTPVVVHCWSRIGSPPRVGTDISIFGYLHQGPVGVYGESGGPDDVHRFTIVPTADGRSEIWNGEPGAHLSFTEQLFERGRLHTVDGNDYFWLHVYLTDAHLMFQDIHS